MSGSPQHPPANIALGGIGLMSVAMLVIPVMDIMAKYLSSTIAPLEVTLARFFFQSVIAFLFVVLGPGLDVLRGTALVPQLARGLFLAGASLLFFIAIKYMPVANALAIFFVEPMILTALSAVFLKESVGWRRWAAVAVGLVGALTILRPGVADFGWPALLPLGTALLFALYLLFTRRLSADGSMLAIQFYTGISGTAFLGVLLIGTTFFSIPGAMATVPDLSELGMMIAIGAISFSCHGLIVLAFARAAASVLAPLTYIEIVSATLLGFIVFGDFPDTLTWVGIGLIVLSGLYIAHRERQRGLATENVAKQ
ncbi:MAG: DMT family transporter [Stappiaceae bacterium]